MLSLRQTLNSLSRQPGLLQATLAQNCLRLRTSCDKSTKEKSGGQGRRGFVSIRNPYQPDRVIAVIDEIYPPADKIDTTPPRDVVKDYKSYADKKKLKYANPSGLEREATIHSERRKQETAFPAEPSQLQVVKKSQKIQNEKEAHKYGRIDPHSQVPESFRYMLREADEEEAYSPDLLSAMNAEEIKQQGKPRMGRVNDEYEASMLERVFDAEPEYRQRRQDVANALSDGIVTPETNYPRRDEASAKWVDPKGYAEKLKERRNFTISQIFETVGDNVVDRLRLENQLLDRKVDLMQEKLESLTSSPADPSLKADFPNSHFLERLRNQLTTNESIDAPSELSVCADSDTPRRRTERRSLRYLRKYGSTRATVSSPTVSEKHKPGPLSMHSLYPPVLRNPPGTGEGTEADFGLISARERVAEFRRAILAIRNAKDWREAFGRHGLEVKEWKEKTERLRANVEDGKDVNGDKDMPYLANKSALENPATNHTGWNDRDATTYLSEKDKLDLLQIPRFKLPRSSLMNLRSNRDSPQRFKNAGLFVGGAPQSTFRPRFMSDVAALSEKPLGAVLQPETTPVPKAITASNSAHAFVQTPISKMPFLTFTRLGVAPNIWPKLHEAGYHFPTAIQLAALPYLLPRRAYNPDFRPPPSFREAHPYLPRYFDAIVQDLTGSGKTLAYLIPAMQHIDVQTDAIQALIICPTRELCVQVQQQAAELARACKTKAGEIRVARLNGRVTLPVYNSFRTHPPHLLITTPSSLLGLMDVHTSKQVRSMYARRSEQEREKAARLAAQAAKKGDTNALRKYAAQAEADIYDSEGKAQRTIAERVAEQRERAFLDEEYEEGDEDIAEDDDADPSRYPTDDYVELKGKLADAYENARTQTERDATLRQARREKLLKRFRNEQHALKSAQTVSLRGVLLPHEQDPEDPGSQSKDNGGWPNLKRETPLMREDLRVVQDAEGEGSHSSDNQAERVIRIKYSIEQPHSNSSRLSTDIVEDEWTEDAKMRDQEGKIVEKLLAAAASKSKKQLKAEELAAMKQEKGTSGLPVEVEDDSDYEVVSDTVGEQDEVSEDGALLDDPRWWRGDFDPLLFEHEFAMASARRKTPSSINFDMLRFVAVDEADLCMHPPSIGPLVAALAHIRLVREDQIGRGLMTLPSPKAHFPYERSPVRSVFVTATVTPALLRCASTFFLDPHAITASEAKASLNALEHNYKSCIVPILRVPKDSSRADEIYDQARQSNDPMVYSSPSFVFPRNPVEMARAVRDADDRILSLQTRRVLPKSVEHYRMFFPVPEELHLAQYRHAPRNPPDEFYPIRVKSFNRNQSNAKSRYEERQALASRLHALEERRRARLERLKLRKQGLLETDPEDEEDYEDTDDAQRDSTRNQTRLAVREDDLARLMKLYANVLARVHAATKPKGGMLVFANNTVHFEELARALECKGFRVGTMLRDSDKSARHLCLKLLAIGKLDVLLASNMVARGIDVQGAGLVVNLGVPTEASWYIHRAGRVDRMSGRQGSLVLTLIPDIHKKSDRASNEDGPNVQQPIKNMPHMSKADQNVLLEIQKLIGKRIQPTKLVRGRLVLAKHPDTVIECRSRSKASAALKRSDEKMALERELRSAGKLTEGETLEVDLDLDSITDAEIDQAMEEERRRLRQIRRSLSMSEADDITEGAESSDLEDIDGDYGAKFDELDASNATAPGPKDAEGSSPTRISIVSRREVAAWQEEQPMWSVLHAARQITVERLPDDMLRSLRKKQRQRELLEEKRKQRLELLKKLEKFAIIDEANRRKGAKQQEPADRADPKRESATAESSPAVASHDSGNSLNSTKPGSSAPKHSILQTTADAMQEPYEDRTSTDEDLAAKQRAEQRRRMRQRRGF